LRLNELETGRSATIKKVETNCNCVLRIMTLGLVEGTKVKRLTSTRDNMEVLVHGRRVALSKHCASNIVV
jgi:Fe2+ transport system protein FeoA